MGDMIDKARAKLKRQIAELLKTLSKDELIKALKTTIFRYEMMSMFATKGGYGGAPDYDKLKICIGLLNEAIEDLKTEIAEFPDSLTDKDLRKIEKQFTRADP